MSPTGLARMIDRSAFLLLEASNPHSSWELNNQQRSVVDSNDVLHGGTSEC